MNYDKTDLFILCGLGLLGILAFYGIKKLIKRPYQKRMAFVAVMVVFFLVWAELAVGIFGTPWAGN